jgi:hypothetical protein
MSRVSRRRSFVVPAVGVVCIVLLAGCSDDEGDDDARVTTSVVFNSEPSTSTSGVTTTTMDPAKRVFLEEGNAICDAMNAEIEAALDEFGPDGPQSLQEFAEAVTVTTDLLEAAVADLRELQPPPGDEAIVEDLLDSVDELVPMSRDFADAFAAEDRVAIAELSDVLGRGTSEVNDDFEAYGLDVCAQDATGTTGPAA